MYAEKERYNFSVKLYIKAGLLCTGVLALFSFFMSAVRVRELLEKVPQESLSGKSAYHAALYLPLNRDSFSSGIISGAQKAALENNISLSVQPSSNCAWLRIWA